MGRRRWYHRAMPEPRRFDLIVRTLTTSLIAVVIVAVAAVETLRTGSVPTELASWGAIIIGVYFGSHASLNGGGIRAARDQQMTEQLLAANLPTHPAGAAATDDKPGADD